MQFTFKREATIMTVLLAAPIILGLLAGFVTFLFPRLAANAVAASDLQVFKATVETRRLFGEEATRDVAMSTFWNRSNVDSWKHEEAGNEQAQLDRYAGGRKRFREVLGEQPFVSIKDGTYLREIQKSAVKCYDDPSSTATFLMVQVVNGSNRGTLGWTCGSTKPIVRSSLVRMPVQP